MLIIGTAMLGGCRQPWYAAQESTSDRVAEAGDRVKFEVVDEAPRFDPSPPGPSDPVAGDPFEGTRTEPEGEDGLTDLLDELQQTGGIDEATRERLTADLRDADPAQRPLILQHLQATLAYRRQQREREPGAQPADSAKGGTHDSGAAGLADTRAIASDDRARDPVPSETGTNPAPSNANDIAAAFAVEDGSPPALQRSGKTGSAGVHSARTPLPEPEPAEVPLTAAVQPEAAESSPPPDAPTPNEGQVVPAAFEEPIYQTNEVAAIAADAPAIESGEQTPLSDLPWNELLDRAIAGLEAATSAAPATSGEIARHARLRLLHLAAENDAAALAPIEGIPPNQQDFWAKQLFGLSTYLDEGTQPDIRQRAALAQRHLQEATDQLGDVAVLEVRNLAFCSSIGGFGVYEPLQRPRFKAGEQVKLYAEVGNYRSEPTEDGHRTLLATSYEVVDENDRRVDSGEFPQVEDVCRTRRRDFHIQYGVNLPTRIYPGTYRLQITIEDMLSRKLGRAAVEFEIVDDRAQAQ